jgi:release factor glutamine methyltransferase
MKSINRFYLEFVDLSLRIWHSIHKFRRCIPVAGKLFVVPSGVFIPEGVITSRLLAQHLKVKKGDKVLDLGTGCGVQAIHAAILGGIVIAVDSNQTALEAAKLNCLINGVADRVEIRKGDLFECVRGEKFDLIIFSPPYIPKVPHNLLESSWRGGRRLELVNRFIFEVSNYLRKKGRIQLIYSSLGNNNFLIYNLKKQGFIVKIIYNFKLPFEEILIIESLKLPY